MALGTEELSTHVIGLHVPDIEGDFKAHLRQLVPLLLNQENLVVKEISGNTVKGSDLVEYFRVGNARQHVVCQLPMRGWDHVTLLPLLPGIHENLPG